VTGTINIVGDIGLPRVSVIITNYNYGQYLLEALDSVLTQNYPEIECIIVDDASTDHSGGLLDGVQARHPDVRIVRHQQNVGQTAAFRSGFDVCSGDYVVFLDADDILLPAFVETHVYVHLSLRKPVGFTSSDMLQTRDRRVVRATMAYLGDYAASGEGQGDNLLRRIDDCAPGLWTQRSDLLADIEKRVHLVDPGNQRWVYAPTSGNCFRRDALRPFLGAGATLDLSHHGDTYINKAVCLVSGVALIDLPLTVYRIHGGNGFTARPELSGFHASDPLKAVKAEHLAWRALADLLIGEADRFVAQMGRYRYATALTRLQEGYYWNPEFPQFEDLSGYIESALRREAAAITAALGAESYAALLDRIRAAKRSPQCLEPRRWVKPLAEMLLTLGRALGAPPLSRAGERLWRW
jgi:glycosyltransferase involved in cell wall biosynthesis